jgi:heme oxygenase
MSSTMMQLDLAARRYGSDAVEGWLQLLAPEITVERYAQQLARAYGFDGSVEAALAYSPLRGFAGLRPCAGYLIEDLIVLGFGPARVARLPQCPVAPFATELEALGWLYVLERVAQIHNTVHVFLHSQLPAARPACRYLQIATLERPERARLLVDRLARFDASASHQEIVVEAMHAAFACATAWFGVDQARAA